MSTKLTAAQRELVRDEAIAHGQRLARLVFAKLGNHSEAHLGEQELAVMLAVAYEDGYVAGTPNPSLCPKCGALTEKGTGR